LTTKTREYTTIANILQFIDSFYVQSLEQAGKKNNAKINIRQDINIMDRNGCRPLQLSPGSGFLLQSLGVQLVQECAVELDSGRTLELETKGKGVSTMNIR
jgi:hypothetical protein